jgi:hypothetical protein
MLRLVTLLFGCVALIVPALAQEPVESNKARRVFDITRNGDKIGTETIETEKNGDITTVKMATRLAVTAAFIELYHFEHTAVETWTAGHFTSYKAHTNANGSKYTISAVAAGGKLNLTVNGQQSELNSIILPTTLWNKDFVDATQMFDADKGMLVSVKVDDLGDEAIELNGAEVQTHHYKITGDFARDVWLQDGLPVRIQLFGSDRSLIVSDLKQSDLEQ